MAGKRKKPRPKKSAPLTPEQQRFVDEYVIDDNGTRAYKIAFPTAAYTTCRTNAAKLLAKANIAAEVRAVREARQKRTRMRADTALREAGRLAYSDPLYLFEDDGVTLRGIRDIPPDTRRAIASVKVRKERTEKGFADTTVDCPECGHSHTVNHETLTRYETIEYKLWPKPAGLDKLFSHLGLTTELTPLESFMSLLPPDLREQVRGALAGQGG